MWLVIAVVLLLIFSGLKLSDGFKTMSYNAMVAEKERVTAEFKSAFVSPDLERYFEQFIRNERNAAVVWSELSKAFQEMDHWKDIDSFDVSSPIYYKNQKELKAKQQTRREMERIALDIMLANRGKVSSHVESIVGGYKAHFYSGYNEDLELSAIRAFELAEWLEKTLQKQGKQIKMLLYSFGYDSKYVWEGSTAAQYHHSNVSLKPFSRSIISHREYVIPPPSVQLQIKKEVK